MRRTHGKWIRRVAFCSLLVTAGAADAQRAIPDCTVSEGTLTFDGHASAGDFVGKTTTVTGQLTGAAELSGARGWVEAPVRTIKTGNDHRDRDMNKAMDSSRYPAVRFILTGVTTRAMQGDSTDAVLHGTFSAHGVTREIEVPVAIVFAPDGAINVRGQFPLNLKDYGIRGLSKFLGILRMDEHVLVHLAVAFRPSAAMQQAR